MENIMWHDMGWGGMWLGWLIWIVVLLLIIYAVVRIVQNSQARDRYQRPDETALDILKKRYAKGEITKEQFDQMKKDLE